MSTRPNKLEGEMCRECPSEARIRDHASTYLLEEWILLTRPCYIRLDTFRARELADYKIVLRCNGRFVSMSVVRILRHRIRSGLTMLPIYRPLSSRLVERYV
jgi:hypothetical protein